MRKRSSNKKIHISFKPHKKERVSSMSRSITYRIKELLQEKNITQKQLAEYTGITESAVSHYIKGDRVPRGMILAKIAKTLGTTADDLLEGDVVIDKERDLIYAKALIARNASQMSMEEKLEFVKLLMDNGAKNETE